MPEPADNGAQGDPVAPPTNPAPNPNPAPTDTTSTQSDSEPLGADGKKALETERQARAQAERDARAEKKRADEYAAKLKELDDAQKSDAEKAIARAEAAEKALADTEARLRQQSVRHAVASAAQALNFHKPDDAYRFLDLEAVAFDDAGNPTGIDDLVKTLAKDHDYLVKPATTTTKGPPPTPNANGNGTLSADEQKFIDRQFAVHTRNRF